MAASGHVSGSSSPSDNFLVGMACRSLVVLASIVACTLGLYASAADKNSAILHEANILAAQGKYQAAITVYKKAIEAAPENPNAYHMYGRTLALMGDLTNAIEQYRKAVDLSKTNVQLLNDFGVALTIAGQYEQAISAFKQAIAVDPKFVSPYDNLGLTLLHTGDFAGAAQAFQNSLKIHPNNPVILRKLDEALSMQARPSAKKDHR